MSKHGQTQTHFPYHICNHYSTFKGEDNQARTRERWHTPRNRFQVHVHLHSSSKPTKKPTHHRSHSTLPVLKTQNSIKPAKQPTRRRSYANISPSKPRHSPHPTRQPVHLRSRSLFQSMFHHPHSQQQPQQQPAKQPQKQPTSTRQPRHHHSHLPPLKPINPTSSQTTPKLYILTFSKELIPNEIARNHFLAKHLPPRNPPIPHLYTINVSDVRPPPIHICEMYSGVSPVVQSYVLPNPRVALCVEQAARDYFRFREKEKQKTQQKSVHFSSHDAKERREVALSVCCMAGTHRSVAVAEAIAKRVRSETNKGNGVWGEGVEIVLKHPHRVKGRWDPKP